MLNIIISDLFENSLLLLLIFFTNDHIIIPLLHYVGPELYILKQQLK